MCMMSKLECSQLKISYNKAVPMYRFARSAGPNARRYRRRDQVTLRLCSVFIIEAEDIIRRLLWLHGISIFIEFDHEYPLSKRGQGTLLVQLDDSPEFMRCHQSRRLREEVQSRGRRFVVDKFLVARTMASLCIEVCGLKVSYGQEPCGDGAPPTPKRVNTEQSDDRAAYTSFIGMPSRVQFLTKSSTGCPRAG